MAVSHFCIDSCLSIKTDMDLTDSLSLQTLTLVVCCSELATVTMILALLAFGALVAYLQSIRQRPKPINGVYSQPGPFYGLKYFIFRCLLGLRKVNVMSCVQLHVYESSLLLL